MTCGIIACRRRCNGHTSAMMNRAKATGVITARAAQRPVNVKTTAQIITERRSKWSPAILSSSGTIRLSPRPASQC